MSIIKAKLPPDVKARLRQAVLGSIDSRKKSNSSGVAVAVEKKTANSNHPQLKTLKKISSELTITNLMSAKSISKSSKKPIASADKSISADGAEKKSIIESNLDAKDQPVVKVEKKSKTKTKKLVAKAKKKAKAPIEAPIIAKPSVFSTNQKSANDSNPVSQSSVANKRFSLRRTTPNDWQKPVKEESLESIFSYPKKPSFKNEIFKTEDSDKKLKKAGGHKVFLKLLSVVLGVLLLVLLFDIFGIYQLGFHDFVSRQTVKILPLPAGQVNGNLISLDDYLSDLSLLSSAMVQGREGLIDYSNSDNIKNKVFYRLAANWLMEDKLKSYNIFVTQKDVADQVDLLLQQTGGRQAAETIVKNIYNIDLDSFTARVLRPMVVREALQKAIMSDEELEINKTAKSKADEILALALATSSDFELLAKQYTEDEAGINTGGDLSWVVEGQLDPLWNGLVFSASNSTIVPELVKSDYGYHVVKVEQKLKNSDTGLESAKVRHILVKVDVDKYIKSLLDGTQITKYVK